MIPEEIEGLRMKPDYKVIKLKPNGQLSDETIKLITKNLEWFDENSDGKFIHDILSNKSPLTEDDALFIDLCLFGIIQMQKLKLEN